MTERHTLKRRRRRTLRGAALAIFACSAAASLAPVAAAAEPPLALDDCEQNEGVYQCSGLVKTWDGVPLDTTLTLPSKGKRDLPLVAELHGLGNSKHEYLDPESTAYTDNAFGWAKDGYAVLTYTARGFWGSCGTPESRAASPAACARGYTHLADARFEGRDTQELVGRLVDEGVVDAKRIGVTGDSYGGGQSFMLAALNDRVMLPGGRLIPWRSADGTRLRLAGAAPVIPWTDLVYAIAPNGTTLSYAIPPADAAASPVGVEKASIANGVYSAAQFAVGPGQPVGEPFVPGRPIGYIAPPRSDPEADVTTWVARTGAGPPYTDPLARSIVKTLTDNHSAYHIDSSHPPAPLFVGSGFTDDIFPVDEVTRFVNRTRREHPEVPSSLLLGDFGHMRASNKPADRERLLKAVHGWLDHHVRGKGPDPGTDVTALRQTCPRDAPSGAPVSASTFGGLARGEVRYGSGRRRALAGGGDPSVAAAVDPVAGGGNACASTPADDQPGTATYRLPAARGDGYTLLGGATVIARLDVKGEQDTAQMAARLWDIAPDGSSQTLVARALYRPSGKGTEVFQLHPNGYRFERGHVAKLELLADDAPYGRPSNAPSSVEVERLAVRLPVRERPDCEAVLAIAAPVVPDGQKLAPGAVRGGSNRCDDGRGQETDDESEGGDSGSDSPSSAAERDGDDRVLRPAPVRAADAGGGIGEVGATRPIARRADGAQLPFTGLGLAAMIATGLALTLLGAAMWRRASRSG